MLAYVVDVGSIRNQSQQESLPSTARWVVYGALAFLVGIALLAPVVLGPHEPGIPKTFAESRTLRTATTHFKSEYGFFPVAKATIQRCLDTDTDFTFGIPESSGLTNTHSGNSEIMIVLLAREQLPNRELQNSRKIVFMDLKQARSTSDSGLGPDGVYRDPWGNPYIITLDLNGDGYCEDALYSRPAVSSNTVGKQGARRFESAGANPDSFYLKTEMMIWSMGPDGTADPNTPAGQGTNSDNILSWEEIK